MALKSSLKTAFFMLALSACSNSFETEGVPFADAGADMEFVDANESDARVDLGARDATLDLDIIEDGSLEDMNIDVDATMLDMNLDEDGSVVEVDMGIDEDGGVIEMDMGIDEDGGVIEVDSGEDAGIDEDSGVIEMDMSVDEDAGMMDLDAGEPDLGTDLGPPPPGIEVTSCSGLTAAITVSNNMSINWNPTSAFISPSEVVRWNVTGNAQTVTSGIVVEMMAMPDGIVNEMLAPGSSLCIRFNAPGTFRYYSDLNRHMTGTITVLGP